MHVPNSVAESLEHWFRYKRGFVEVAVDNDYNFGVKTTRDFAENFMKQLTFRLVGTDVKIRKENKLKATVKFPNGNILDFSASVSDSRFGKLVDFIFTKPPL